MCAELIALMKGADMAIIREIKLFYTEHERFEKKRVGWYEPHPLIHSLAQFFHNIIPGKFSLDVIYRVHFYNVYFNSVIIYLRDRLKFKP